MRNGCNVFDKCYIQTCCLQGTDCSFTTAAGAFYENFNCLQTVIGSSFCSCICSHLCCIGCGFSGTSKAQLTSTCPGKRIPCCVSNCNDCIIESGLDMSLATFYFSFITASASRCLFHSFLCHLPQTSLSKYRIISSCSQRSFWDLFLFLRLSLSSDL